MTPQLLRSAPYFPVANIERSAEHYERVLGFRREYVGGTPAVFAILSRDGLPIMLRLVSAPERISPNERQGGTWDAFFWVRDARALHASSRPAAPTLSMVRSCSRSTTWRSSPCAMATAMCSASASR
jgi:hypothetical protein